ncbi:MAG: Crp/Fnr family transcriptional regulator [Saprospiraceae bacterium]
MSDQYALIDKAIAPYILRNAFVYENLPVSDRAALETASPPQQMRRKKILFRQGTYPHGAFRLHSGKVKIYTESPNGQRQTICIYTDGDLLGYRQLLSDEAYPISAELLEDSSIGLIPAEVFQTVVRESSFFSRNLLEALAREFSIWMNRLIVFAQHPVQSRLILCLLILHRIYTREGRQITPITITRTELAEYVGASLETVVRALAPLRAAGMVQVQGRRIILPDPVGLLVYLPS